MTPRRHVCTPITTAHPTIAGNEKYVKYISFSKPIDNDTGMPTHIQHDTTVIELDDVLLADDTPSQLLEIPFKFPYYGRKFDKVFVNANGVLHFKPGMVYL